MSSPDPCLTIEEIIERQDKPTVALPNQATSAKVTGLEPDFQGVVATMSQELIGEKLGSFRLEEILGSGAMGVVFRATQETTGRQAAVKIVHGELAQKGKVFERFEREAEILKQFRHPNIVRWLAWGRFKGTSYFAMEYVEGVTLEGVLQERGELPWREAVDFTIQLCDALEYAHGRSVVHRDLKPSNLMITPDGKLKLTDFGIAKDLERTTQLTAPGRTLGTAAYMAPEQIRGTPAVSHKTDLYALGILMYQMLTGKTPFDGASAVVLMHCHLNECLPDQVTRSRCCPKALNELVVNLMARRPRSPLGRGRRGTRLEGTAGQGRAGTAHSHGLAGAGLPRGQPSPGRSGRTCQAIAQENPQGRYDFRHQFGFRDPESGQGVLGSRSSNRPVLESIGLAATLVVIVAFMGYWLWPPSAAYLYHQAELLMASTHRSDWLTAQEEYLDTLDKKYPGHAYAEQVRKWRDQILLDEAEGRARNLSSPVATVFSEPHTDSERQFVSFDTLARKATAEGNDELAVTYWKEMARLISSDDRDERKWHLLAVKRATELEKQIQERRGFVSRTNSIAPMRHCKPADPTSLWQSWPC